MNKMKVKMTEIRTVLEGSLTNGGSLTLEYVQQGKNKPEHISINAQKEETFINGGYYSVNNSVNLTINGYAEGTGVMLDEIYKQCKAIGIEEVDAVEKVK